MQLTLRYFVQQISENPLLLASIALALGIIFVNGSTVAPNAIATCVVTRCLSARRAIVMGAVFNFLGVLVMSTFNSSVARTIYNIVDLGTDTHAAMITMMGAMLAIVIFSSLSWVFGFPSSQGHALVAGITGSAVAMHGSFACVNGGEWLKVIYGLLISVVLGFASGWLVCRLVTFLFRGANRRRVDHFFRHAEIAGAAAMGFMHGAQDGQKFMGVLLMSMFITSGQGEGAAVAVPLWLMVMCSAVMALGTALGGKKIIKSVGMDMVKLEKYQGFSADFAAATCLLVSSLFGIPMSTPQCKTTAIMGVAASRRLSAINFGVAKEMGLTWILTFPGCGLIGFIMTRILLMVL